MREIERKFLVGPGWREQKSEGIRFQQGYLANNERCSVRVRIEGDVANINIKEMRLGVSREEYEYAVPVEEARQLLDTLCQRPLIDKTRYEVANGSHVWEIDEFHGANHGLVVAEIELSAEDEEFSRPDWLGKEVTSERRYYNVALAVHPYQDWDE